MPSTRNSASVPTPAAPVTSAAPELTRQVMFGEAAYNEVMHFLIEEAHLLDEDRFADWMKLLTNDFVCRMPVRQSVHRSAGAGFSPSMNWMREDIDTLTFKVQRLQSNSAFNEDPPSRMRRMITNLRLHETPVPDEYLAESYLLLRRNRGDAHATDSLSARRDDLLRRTADGWRVARRTVWVDQSVLGMSNLTVFL